MADPALCAPATSTSLKRKSTATISAIYHPEAAGDRTLKGAEIYGSYGRMEHSAYGLARVIYESTLDGLYY